MSRTNSPGQYLAPVAAAGTAEAALADRRGFYTLTAGTYFVELNEQSATLASIHPQWSSALQGTITLESTEADVNDAPTNYNTADGTWIQQDPTSGYVPIVGTGASVVGLTITLAGGGAGSASLNLADLSPARLRLRVVVTTSGALRVAHSGKRS